ncbi:MAG: RteC domain-containing protein [Zunongwangia sp.]|uniref:RteC domain-containing protein n=1 Tax=Zunongwangia sp. TaxID=1965325 RepID=UPI003242BC94
MDFQLLTNQLKKDLDNIKIQNENILERAYRSIEVCRDSLSALKKDVIAKDFKSIQDEIYFFKVTKQFPLVELIYFSEIHSFEIQFPKINLKSQLKAIKKKSNKINRFFLYNLDFGRYIESGQTHFDKEYFTREYLNGYHITLSKFYFQDPEFCTARDMLLGKYNAYKSFSNYLKNKRASLKKGLDGNKILISETNKLHWPFSHTDYVELIYALHSKGLGTKNNVSIVKISNYLQQVFDIEPKDIYKTYQDIKYRKKSRTLFLDDLTISLLSEMDNSEK